MTTAVKLNVGRRMDAQDRMLADVRRRVERSCGLAVPGAWQVLDAIYGGRSVESRPSTEPTVAVTR